VDENATASIVRSIEEQDRAGHTTHHTIHRKDRSEAVPKAQQPVSTETVSTGALKSMACDDEEGQEEEEEEEEQQEEEQQQQQQQQQ
jgi:hypothetical protein